MWTKAVVPSAVCGLLALAAMHCGDGGASGANGHGAGSSGVTSPGALSVFPDTAYTGVDDGGGKYVVPVAVSNGAKVTWSSSDATIATVSGDDASATVSPVKAGTVTITAKAGTQSATMTVTVQTYVASARAAGQTAFATYKCASCHGAAGTPDITPSGICKHTDAQIEAAVTQGTNPEGGDIKIGKAAHSFAIAPSDAAFAGIAAFLRSQTPEGIPTPDG
jgi:mono/diheme cytochrome c family protein